MSKLRSSKVHPIASRVARRLDRFLAEKVVDLSAIREGRAIAEKLQRSGPGPAALGELHPVHAAYVFVMNQVSILAEALTQLDELDRISGAVNRAEDEFVPGGPPMSPLTLSYFNAWTFFDCGAGIERETIGSIVLDLRERLRMHSEFAALLEKWQASRMGLYELEEPAGPTVRLRELVTDVRFEAINTTGYRGTLGAVWYVRALPPPVATFEQHVLVTTPYEVVAPGPPGWMNFLERTLPETKIADPKRAYEHLMKWGLGSNYSSRATLGRHPHRRGTNFWHEYIFEAYLNHERDGIRLMGLPDVPESLPHSRINEDGDGPLREYVASGRMVTGALA